MRLRALTHTLLQMRAIKTVRTEDVVLGQYTAGAREPGYTDDDGVPNDSQTATYAAMHLRIDNERWEGVPLLIKAGKALSETKMEVCALGHRSND